MESVGSKRKGVDDIGGGQASVSADWLEGGKPIKQSSIAPSSGIVNAMCTDLYQITMAYGYWRSGKHNQHAVFEAFFRKNPFKGEYTVFAGSDEVLKYVSTFSFSARDVEYLKTCGMLGHCEPEFWEWMLSIDCSQIKVYMVDEGELVFPRTPLVRVEGPLAIAQLLETTILNLINFPCLVATNASRMRLAALENFDLKRKERPDAAINRPENVQLLEFGLRRAQGPDGSFSASKYAYVGGFQASSNVIAGQMAGIPIRGTMAHSFITSFFGVENIDSAPPCPIQDILKRPEDQIDLLPNVIANQKLVHECFGASNNQCELLAFASFAASFPSKFIALVDTFDSLKSGVLNYLIVGLSLHQLGYNPIGIRLDSGDLGLLSKETRKMFIKFDEFLRQKKGEVNLIFSDNAIVASNDLDEEVLVALNNQGHEINIFAIGTNLVTCSKQPALGCVYKLVEVENTPRIKLSQDTVKITIPARKQVYRLYCTGETLDVMIREGEDAPEAGKVFFCRDPYQQEMRANVTPSRVDRLLKLKWRGRNTQRSEWDQSIPNDSGAELISLPTLQEGQERCKTSIQRFLSTNSRSHLRIVHPVVYKIYLSGNLYNFLHEMKLAAIPIPDIK